MNKTELECRARLTATLTALGFTESEVESLRRISNTLQRWYEMECGTDTGAIERDEDTGKPFLRSSSGRWPVADRETGAKKRLATIVDACNKARRTHLTDGKMTPKEPLAYYLQTDPRGAALYILRPGDVPAGDDPAAYYSRGICVY
jgi:hypothetical protein